jgi:hypothetical protein
MASLPQVPTESSDESERTTSWLAPDISAIPAALSVIGPKASAVMMNPIRRSVPILTATTASREEATAPEAT